MKSSGESVTVPERRSCDAGLQMKPCDEQAWGMERVMMIPGREEHHSCLRWIPCYLTATWAQCPKQEGEEKCLTSSCSWRQAPGQGSCDAVGGSAREARTNPRGERGW